MAKRSATDTLKSLNSGNKSGAIKQALDLIKNLQNSKAGQVNPEAISAMGGGQVAGMLKGLMKMSGGEQQEEQQQPEEDEEKRRLREEIERLKQQIEDIEQFDSEHP